MSIGHLHPPGVFDAGHCRACARQAGLLDHYDRVQGEEARLRRTVAYARAAHRYALWALGSSGPGSCWPRSACWFDESTVRSCGAGLVDRRTPSGRLLPW